MQPVPLNSALPVPRLAFSAVAAATRAAAAILGDRGEASPSTGTAVPDSALDARRIAAAYSSERWFRIDGESPSAWAPLSGFWPCASGWLRTHGNYPHHAARLRSALGIRPDLTPEDAVEAVRSQLGTMPATDAAARVTAAGGIATAVRAADPDVDARLAVEPLVARAAWSGARPREWRSGDGPLAGIRVLDLTRVIAGPVATRTLGYFGADVLRIDSPRLPEIGWQHLDTGAGKRTTLLDLRTASDAAVFSSLLDQADVVVLGYRPQGLDALGLNPERLAAAHPGIVIARLSAWGFDAGDEGRRGFDSIVQAASGIAWIESPDGERPGALPAQALDHSAGYLLAAAVMDALRLQRAEGGSHLVQTSLRRVAAELLTMPPEERAEPDDDLSDQTVEHETSSGRLRYVRPAARLAGMSDDFAYPPHPWGTDVAQWLPR
jgi:crotonobetainyl-CoA:carnitine CoA-transferase CaiB-like acyl-CoA transferase